MKICLQIPKNKKYILACSFGPDSMALLDAALKENLDVVIAHVNYHHRDASNYEERELRKYCKNHNLKLEVLDLLNTKSEGNFEAWARQVRYEFFHKVLKRNKADYVLVGHHQDDLIETYLMQKKRGIYAKKWGIAEKTEIFGVEILRPFLNYSKAELLTYCKENNIPYSIDITNLTNDYERNKIRHEIVEKLSTKERTDILTEIRSQTPPQITPKNKWTVEEFSNLNYEEIIYIFDYYFVKRNEHRNLSKSFVKEIQKFSMSKKANCELKITENFLLAKAYGNIYFVNQQKLRDYRLLLKKPGEVRNDFLHIRTEKDSSDRNIFESDYPLIIRNAKNNDQTKVSDHEISIKRLFIDWKMPKFVRRVWPVIENNDGKLIYIPRYRDYYVDNHKTKFVIDLDYFLIK